MALAWLCCSGGVHIPTKTHRASAGMGVKGVNVPASVLGLEMVRS